MLEIVMATHAGMTTAEFEQIDVDPERAVADLNIPRAMVKALGHARCGVYAEVTAFGRIAPGDAVAHTYGYPVLEQCSAKLNHLRRRDFTGRAGARRSLVASALLASLVDRTHAAKAPGPLGLRPGGRRRRCAARPMRSGIALRAAPGRSPPQAATQTIQLDHIPL